MATPIRFFTIVLNGMPFLRYHLSMMQKLTIPWEWHIAEGLAELRHDTAWSVRKRWTWRKPFRLQTTGWLPHEFHEGGRSIDGTSEYLDEIAALDSSGQSVADAARQILGRQARNGAAPRAPT